jgi:hypothetical protein
MAVTNFEDKMKAWAYPILLSMVSFFMVALVNKVDKIYVEVQAVKETVIEVKVDTRYSKETIVDHGQRLRALEMNVKSPTDNTRVNYETYNR